MIKILLIFTLLIGQKVFAQNPVTVTVGSKAFTEGYLLGELIAQNLESRDNTKVERRFGMGATGILFEALKSGQIDVYPEYTGTIAEGILKRPDLKSWAALQQQLREIGLTMSEPLGFENNYALAVPEAYAVKHDLKSISDIKKVQSSIRTGFSHEFVSRADGLRPLLKKYGINLQGAIQPVAHSLSYQAIENGSVELIDVYSTDAKIQTLGLRVLDDDLGFFTSYQAVVLARLDFALTHPSQWAAIQSMENSLNEDTVRSLNARVDEKKMSFRAAIQDHLQIKSPISLENPTLNRLILRTKEHTVLVMVSILFSIFVGIPFGIIAAKNKLIGQGILLIAGLLQTIPSLALLCFLIPFSGIGVVSAVIALCLYALLPVVTNTFVGLRSIDGHLIEMSNALGLSRMQRLIKIELPLASRNILSGIRTSAVISIGTATLAALIGAGGYGAIILAGLAINDTSTIMLGAAPSAAMALIVHGLFEALGLVVIPKGLR